MDNENDQRIYCSNMKDNDPVIEKFMKEYLQEKADMGQQPSAEDLIVNFDISCEDGNTKSYTCGGESAVFDGCIEPKIVPRKVEDIYNEVGRNNIESSINYHNKPETDSMTENYMNQYVNDEDSSSCNNIYDDAEYNKKDFDICEDDCNKWLNCEDELNELNKCESQKEKCHNECVKGKILVYAMLGSKEGTRIKGVKINLYKLNGICPELVISGETNYNGEVIFSDIPEGSYRIIELIDKRYFEKPSYINWNEVTIDQCNNSDVIYVINKIKSQRYNKNCR